MKTKIFIIILSLTAASSTLFTYGSTKIGNLYYDLDYSTKTAELTNEYAKYSRSLTTINIPSVVRYSNVNYTVVGIGDDTFFGCDWVTLITIPNTVTTIGSGAFGHCSSLTSLTIPNSVESIGGEAFSYCTGITSLTIPNSVTSIGSNAFGNVNNVIYEGTATGNPWGAKSVNGYVEDGLVYLDDTKTALLGCSSATTGNIIIPNSVTSIGDYAFYGCSSITSINIPDKVSSIGRCAFRGCSGLTSLTIPNSVKNIGQMAFQDCTGFTSVTIPNSVTSIGSNAFYKVNNIIYEGTATGTPWGAKYRNGYIEEGWVYSDNTKTTLVGCSSAATGEIVIPSTVTNIGNYALYNCSGITSCIVSDNVINIGDPSEAYVFKKCSNLRTITIPNSVTRIGAHSFDNCDSLKSIIFNADYLMSHYSFSGSTNFNTIFGNQIEECIFGDNVTRINSYTFYRCTNLKSIIIPSSATAIGDYVFYGCTKLTSITNYATTPQNCYANDFTNVDKSACTLYVPEESIELYQTADGWKDFANIVKIPVPTYNVSFLDYDDSILSEQEVEEGNAAIAPSNPSRAGYTFTGWDKDFSNVIEDMVITAQYELGEEINFTIYFNDKEGDEIISSEVVLKVPAAPDIVGFTFLGWKPVASFITNTIDVQAIYESNTPTNAPEVVTNPANPAQKLIRDGNVYILTDDHTYTIQGQEVR